MEPVVPPLTAECPDFKAGTISFMGLSGITVAAGAKPAGPTAPMLFYWHGTGSTAGEYAFMAAAVSQGIMSEGGVLVSFEGSTGGDFLSGTAIFGKGDFALADQLLACAVKNNNVDPHRIYTMGCSAGGLFSTAMAAMRSSYIAAAAPNSGGSSGLLTFENKHVPALMTVHGMMGMDVVGIDFAQASATADMAFKAMGGFTIDCDTGGGHCGGGGLAGDVWTFFKAHPFGVTPEPWAAGLPAGFSTQCKKL
jgi:poly(3-hydroxybutyrate) depolymerase